MKRTLLTLTLAAALCLPALFAQKSAAEEPIVLTFNLGMPPIHQRWVNAIKPWCDELEKRSNGRIKIEPYFANALGKRSDAMDSVRTGIADLAEAPFSSNPGAFPFHSQIFSAANPSMALGNAYEMLAQIADGCGLELGQTAEEIAALNPNAALACQLSAADGLTTWRDCVAAIAQLLGGFGTVDRAGRLVIRQFAKTSCVSLGADARSEAGVSDFRCHYAALTVATQSGSYAAGGGQDTGLTMAIADMPLAEKGLPDTRQGITDNLFAELRQLDYTPATVTMPGDPALEPGDRVALPQADGTAPEMLVTHFVWHYHGRQTLKSVGRNPYLANNSDGTTEKLLRKVQNSAESKRLVYYSFTNTAALTVRTAETPAVSIAFAAVEDTSAMFLAQLLLTAEPEGGDPLTLEVRYYVNEVRVENFTPQQRLLAGAHTLALFYPFASVEANAAKRLSVRLVCTGGTVKIAPYSIKATVTGQGMASELPWDGTLQFEELLMPLQLTERKVILE